MFEYPGVYIEEVPGQARTITGAPTSITAFIGRALRGPLNEPVRIRSLAEFGHVFGGLWAVSSLGYAVQHYFLNGGTDAIVVRVHNPSSPGAQDTATITLPGSGGALTLEATSPGAWGRNLRARISYDAEATDRARTERDPSLFNLIIEDMIPGTDTIGCSEQFPNVSEDESSPRYITTVLAGQSHLVRVRATTPSNRPDATVDPHGVDTSIAATGGHDGHDLTADQLTGPGMRAGKQGIYALAKVDVFNLMCIPPLTRDTNVADTPQGLTVLKSALEYCRQRRAMLLVDPPSSWNDAADAETGVEALGLQDENAAIYFPRVKVADPLSDDQLMEFAPCGVVAGIIARTDSQRGVWRSPAGQEATLTGVQGLSYTMTDAEQARLESVGVNCLRTFPSLGHVCFGARTLAGADRLASEWKYISVRRLALYIEESLYRGTRWVVFEPNDEELWTKIRQEVGSFMHTLFCQGAFQGSVPRDAYFVECGSETTTKADVTLGVVNILVGFAPLKPAEFMVIKIQQMAGQSRT